MFRVFKAGLPGLAFCLLAAAAVPSTAAEAPSYNFSPVNQYNLQDTARFWNPIIRYVSSKSGVRLNLKLGRTSTDTTSFILAREVDFAFTNHLFSPERMKMGWTVFGRRNTPPIRGQIVVPADSAVRNLAELAGATVAFAGPEALIAYKVPYTELLRKNIGVNVVFTGNHDAAFSQLFAGTVKAAGANSQLVDGYAGRAHKAFRVLWSSAPFNELALMASPRVPPAQVRAVAQAFLTMHQDPEGRKILEAAGELVHAAQPVSFVPALEADYASYRAFYESAPISLR